MSFSLSDHSHRRFNALTGEWVQVSPHRAKRPWQGQTEKNETTKLEKYDASCYLCPGNLRSNGERNPEYKSSFSFENDFASLVDDVPEGSINFGNLIVAKSERGICKVVCFSPRHDLTVANMSVSEVESVVHTWIREFREIGGRDDVNYVQIFENKGLMMGCSNPHPHGQIWAQESIPVEPSKKQHRQSAYYIEYGETLLKAYLNLELEFQQRIVMENEHFVALVPFWAVWPFEMMILPRRPMTQISEMTPAEISAFAQMYRNVAVTYDKLFDTSFPYSAGIHQAPTDGQPHREWHWHMVFYPPLLRSATVKKFMVGYEMLGNPQRDITPEFAAEKLRSMNLHNVEMTLK